MTKTFRLKDIACPECATKIETAIAKIDGIKNVSLDYLSEKLTINFSKDNVEKIIPKIKTICSEIDPHTIFVDYSK